MNFTSKLRYILNSDLKKALTLIGLLTFLGMLFEMVGIGVFIPVFGVLLDETFLTKYSFFRNILLRIGSPTHTRLSIYLLILLVIFYLVKTLFLIYLNNKQSKFIAKLNIQLLNELFQGYMNQPYLFHLQNNSSKLIRNLQSEITQFSNLAQAYLTLTLEFSMIFGICILLVFSNPIGTFSIITLLIISMFLFQKFSKKNLQKWGKIRQDQAELINKNLFQGLGAIKEIILTNKSKYFVDKVKSNNTNSASVTVKYLTLQSIPRLFLEFITIIGLAFFCFILILQDKPLEVFLPTIGLFAAASFRLIPSAGKIMNAFQVIKFFQPAVDLLYKEFKNVRNQSEKNSEFSKVHFANELIFKNINFKYPNTHKNALNNISFTIKRGESIGIIGKSGAGKSTLVNIIIGLLVADNGNILIDGCDVETSIEHLSKQVGYVPQNIYLVDDTIASNIAFGIDNNEINLLNLIDSIKSAKLEELISSLPNGINTIVGERGANLSGGQIQRIGIARALYNNPEILVFDEATSALDINNEVEIIKTINSLKGKKTIIFISHRPSTLSNCDRIYKIENGFLLEEPS